MKNNEKLKALLIESLGAPLEIRITVANNLRCYSNERYYVTYHDLWIFRTTCNEHNIETTVKVNDKPNDCVFTTIEIPDAAIGFGFNAKDGYTIVYRYTLNEYLKAELKRYGIEDEVVRIVETICDACEKQ